MAAYHQGRSGAAVEGRLGGIVADARPLAQLAVARRALAASTPTW